MEIEESSLEEGEIPQETNPSNGVVTEEVETKINTEEGEIEEGQIQDLESIPEEKVRNREEGEIIGEEGEITEEGEIVSLEREKKEKKERKEKKEPKVNPSSSSVKVVASTSAVPPLPEPKERELEKTWKIIESGSPEFATWTKLLSCADNEESVTEIRRAYETFLSEYPLCYVYWKRYADHEFARGNPEKVIEIYEKALTKAVPHSVDLWSHYCSFIAEKSDNLDEIRSLFERGLKIVGTDFAAHPLWDKYLGFEISQEEFKRIGQIFSRVIHIPLEQIASYWLRYKLFVAERPIEDIATETELQQLREQNIENEDKQKGWIIAEKEKIYLKTLEDTNIRRPFEQEALKINYFHVRPLDDVQLNNWAQYLEFEEKQGDHVRTVKLYERCVIPCCNYTKFWLRYIRYIERYGREQARQAGTLNTFTAAEAREIFERVCYVFLKKRPDIHLEYATFEEQYHNYDSARAIYEKLKTIVPGHIESTLRHISLERRLRCFGKCEELYKEAIQISTEETHTVFLYIHYAKMVGRVYESPRRAREVFSEGIEKYGKFKDLWIAFVNFEKTRGGPDVEERVASVYDQAVHHYKGLPETDRISLLLDWIEYCSDEGTNLPRLRDLSNEYREAYTLYESSTSMMTGFKRALENADEPPNKIPRVGDYTYDTTTIPTGNGDYYYSTYYGYDYNAYGAYGSYSNTYDPSATTNY